MLLMEYLLNASGLVVFLYEVRDPPVFASCCSYSSSFQHAEKLLVKCKNEGKRCLRTVGISAQKSDISG